VKQKPLAYRSPLWAYLDDIRKWRQAGDTWGQIANKLKAEPYKITTSFQAVQAFFKRSSKVGDPLGYQIKKQQPRQAAPLDYPAPAQPPGDVTTKKVRAIHEPEPEPKFDPYAP
jgi:hypothetical protein